MSATGEYVIPPDCLCGCGYFIHNIETAKKPCSRLSCGCTVYRPKGA